MGGQADLEFDNAIAGLPNSAAHTSLGTLCISSFPTPTWVAELKASYVASPAIQTILSTFQDGGVPPKGFSLVDGLLFFKGRIYLGPLVLSSLQSCNMFIMDQWEGIQVIEDFTQG